MDDYPELGTPAVAEGVGMVKGDLLRGGDGQITRGARVRCTQTRGCARLGAGREAPGPALATLLRARDRTLPCQLRLSTTKASLLRLPDLASIEAGLTGVGRCRQDLKLAELDWLQPATFRN